ncbi:ABC transporter permease [Chryseolinea sp. T2]|uniref:ABC transporter permease n=1 Tax=Chryseolinea sp. T2 TaxID=3129255 RepID=UPI0030787762
MNPQPPKRIVRLIEQLAPRAFQEDILGDLDEMFASDIKHGNGYARRRYTINGLGFLFKSFFWTQKRQPRQIMMIGSYFKMARRSLMAYKTTTSINILGLVIGIATALVIFTVTQFEKSFDTFHSQANNTYRLVRAGGTDMSEFRTGISFPVPPAIKAEVPELVDVTSIEYFGGANVEILDSSGTTLDKYREEAGFTFVQSNFFKVFDYKGIDLKWISGSAVSLDKPGTIVLTKTMARKYFGDSNPVGQNIKLQRKFDFTVAGVIEDFPSNTDFPFTVLLSYSTLPRLNGEQRMNDWVAVNDSHHTYVTVAPGASPQDIEKKIAKTHATHTWKELSDSRHYLLQKLSDVHFDSRFGTYTRRTISKETLMGLAAVALFLLLTASINYINLSTAQSSLRAKEIGLRKVMGSIRRQVMVQYLIETFLVVSMAGFVALGICQLLVFYLQGLLNMPSSFITLPGKDMMVVVSAIIVVLTLFAGFYPSLVLSRLNPVETLKSKFGTDKVGGFSFRKVLVVAQFTLTQIMVVGTFIIVMQMRYFGNTDMGFDKDNVIAARTPVRDPVVLKGMEDKLRSQAFVTDVSFSYTLPGGVRRNGSYADIGRPEASSMSDFQVYEYVSIDENFLDLYNIKLLAGRNLVKADTARNILINETLLKGLALGSPTEALGQKLKMGDQTIVTVVGVVGDYYSNSMKEAPGNIVMVMQPENYTIVSIKINTPPSKVALQNAVSVVDKIWSETFPEFMFSYVFLDENIAAYYVQEDRYAKLFQLFSIVLLTIGSLGLYGLITFVVNRKGKEVAIRKVLGASIANILTLFTREYLLLIVLSFALAVPVAVYFVNDWLSNFRNHVSLSWYYFVVPGIIVLAVALLVILGKSMRAATLNPVDKLRYD